MDMLLTEFKLNNITNNGSWEEFLEEKLNQGLIDDYNEDEDEIEVSFNGYTLIINKNKI